MGDSQISGVNHDKCKVMQNSTHKINHISSDNNIHNLPNVEEPNLAIMLSSNASFSNKIDNTCCKAKTVLGPVMRLFTHTEIDILRTVYMSVNRPLL